MVGVRVAVVVVAVVVVVVVYETMGWSEVVATMVFDSLTSLFFSRGFLCWVNDWEL